MSNTHRRHGHLYEYNSSNHHTSRVEGKRPLGEPYEIFDIKYNVNVPEDPQKYAIKYVIFTIL